MLALLALLTFPAHAGSTQTLTHGGREIIVYEPADLGAPDKRSAVMVFHGGLGNAEFMNSHQDFADAADRHHFVVAFMNGTRVAVFLRDKRKGWNAGKWSSQGVGCCGLPARSNVDDVGYIREAASFLSKKFQIPPERIYGLGHSNGAMMVQRVACTTELFKRAVAISGTLMADLKSSGGICPGAKAKTIWGVHGTEDESVPVGGGFGKGLAHFYARSEEETRILYERSGAKYVVHLLPAGHSLGHIRDAVRSAHKIPLEEWVLRFFQEGS